MNEQNNKNYTINENGNIVAHNYCAAELPKITVTIHSGQTTYRFNGSYDGNRSLPAKLLDHMVKDNEKHYNEMVDLFTNVWYDIYKQSCIGRLPAD